MHAINHIKALNQGKKFQTQDQLIRYYDATILDIKWIYKYLGIIMLPDLGRHIN